jgi:hypothetical protein
MSSSTLFLWIPVTDEEKPLALNWTHNGVRYEFHVPILSSRTICRGGSWHRGQEHYCRRAADEDHHVTEFINVFPRTLKYTIRQEWKQLEADSGFQEYNVDDFEELLMEFVDSLASDQDHSDLVNQLR